MKRIYRLISLSDTPVALAVLLGAVAWLATSVVARQLEEPILEYSETWLSGSDPETAVPGWRPEFLKCLRAGREPVDRRLLLMSLENLSRTVRLEEVELALSIESDASMLRLAARAIAPGIAGKSAPVCDEINGEIGPLALHPGGIHQFIVEVDRQSAPVVRLVHSKAAVNLVHANLRTFLVKYYTALATGIAALFFALVVAYLAALDKANVLKTSEESST